MSTYHETAQSEKTNLLTVAALRHWRPGELIKTCLRCGCYFIRTGRAFTVRCAEGRTVVFSICRACAKLHACAPKAAPPPAPPAGREERRAAA